MRWEEIKNHYKSEWVLVDVTEVDEGYSVVSGNILAHSQDKEEIYRKLLQIRPKNFTIEYTGQVPEDLAVVLQIENA